jgi:hypothetical protein
MDQAKRLKDLVKENAHPKELILGATSYPGVDATQGQRALLDRHAVQFFNRRSHRKRNAWGRA